MSESDGACLYRLRNDAFAPTALTTGPWRPDAQHGGPPSALLGRTIEAALDDGWAIGRITIELVRPVPLEALRIETSIVEVSRRVRHIRAEMRRLDDTIVATGTGLALQATDLPEPGWQPEETATRPGPERTVTPPEWLTGDGVAYHRDAVEHRFVSGQFGQPGAADDWVRLRQPLVEGETTSPLCRVLAAADFGSGVSAVYDIESGVGLINADLTVAIHRPLIGEWVRLQSVTRVGAGIGHGTTTLSDEHGVIGIGSQSLLGQKMTR